MCIIRMARAALTHKAHNGTNHFMDVFEDVLMLLLHEWQHLILHPSTQKVPQH